MSGIKPITDPNGTLFRGKIPIGTQEIFVEAYIIKENLLLSVAGNKLAYPKRILIECNLSQIVEAAMQQLTGKKNPDEMNDEEIAELKRLKGKPAPVAVKEEAAV